VIICKGIRVIVDLDKSGKRAVFWPKSWGKMHDPDGKDWPKDSMLVIPYKVTGEPIDYGPARHYFGDSYDTQSGEVTLPPREMKQWTRIGEVRRIWYTRPGTSHPGPFRHEVGGGWLEMILGKRRAILYRRPRAYRLEFPDGLIADARGFVHP